MSAAILQRFPRRNGDAIEHVSWELDLAAARKLNRLGTKRSQRLVAEAEEMAAHFSRWLLTVSARGERIRCAACGGMLVFDRGLRCVACGRTRPPSKLPRGARLTWFGLMPPIGIDGLAELKPAILRKPPAEHLVGERPDLGHFLLVPLCAAYPADFPSSPVEVHYQAGIFEIPGMPAPTMSHATHLLNDRIMCLFTASQWRSEMTCREVLQQRTYAHVIKLLNYGNGKREAFGIVS